ncbi:MAG: hypothetical protein ACLUQK_14085 [Clostridium sp.]
MRYCYQWEQIPAEQLILSIGHSARDTYRMLQNRGVTMHPKAFAIGARIEHPQTLIDQANIRDMPDIRGCMRQNTD